MVLVVQIFAVAVELPKKYMLKHWLSVLILLLPVMTFGWLISSVFIWKLVPSLRWVEALVLAACVTATDPVLASAVVGKGKFARRVPGHLRNLLSAESGCNDGMAFPFAYLALLCIQHAGHSNEIAFHFIVITCLYECLFGTFLGAVIGYCGRHAIKFAEKKNLIDRESFLVFYFVLALFCTGVGSIIGVDDLLVAFAAGAAFSWDGWFARKTEESHVSNVIDLLLNMAYFVYFGAIVPWDQFNEASLGLSPWKLVIIAILIILFRRIPIMLALKPVIPDIRTWREALFCGHFGPIGVGAVFMSILSRAELEHDEPTPLAELPKEGHPNFVVVACIWPVTTFLIVASILVHGSSIAVFTLGKRLNNLTITMTYTTNGDHSQSWLSRIPRMDSARTSFSFTKNDTTQGEPLENVDIEGLPIRPATSSKPVKPGVGMKRRGKKSQRKHLSENERVPQNIPIDLNADRRAERERIEQEQKVAYEDEKLGVGSSSSASQADLAISKDEEELQGIQAYQEGSKVVVEDSDGEVIDCVDYHPKNAQEVAAKIKMRRQEAQPDSPLEKPRKKLLEPINNSDRSGHRVVAYRLDDNIIVENLEGEVIRRYRIASGDDDDEISPEINPNATRQRSHSIIDKTLSLVGIKRRDSHLGPVADVEKQGDDSEFASVPTTSIKIDGHKFDDERMKVQLKRLLGENERLGPKPTPVLGSSSTFGNVAGSNARPRKALSPEVSPTNSSAAPVGLDSSIASSALAKSAKRPSSPPPPIREYSDEDDEVDEDEADDDEESENDQGDYDDDDEETEFEKRRRLAALAQVGEEDDDVAFLAARARAVRAAEEARTAPSGKQ